MGQSILGIDLQSTHEIFGCLFQVSFFIAKRSAIEQSIDFLWINAQSVIVRFDRLRPVIFLGVIFERGGQPVISIGPGHDARFFVKLASLEIQYELTRQWLQAGSAAFYKDVFSVEKDAQFSQGRLRVGELFTKRGKRSPQPTGGHSFFGPLLDSAEANQVAKIVEAASLFFSTSGKYQAIRRIHRL